MRSQTDSETSRRTSSSSDSTEQGNLIRTCIKKYFDTASYAKFQQVLDYVGEPNYAPLYHKYQSILLAQLERSRNVQLPDGYSINTHISLNAKFYAFRFIANVGLLIIKRLESGDEKAEYNFVTLAKTLLFHSLATKCDTANLALVELEQLCFKRNLTLPKLFQAYRVKFLRLIIKAILHKIKIIKETKTEMDDLSSASQNNNSDMNGSGLSARSNYVIAYMTRAFEVFNKTSITREDVAQSLVIITNLIQKEIYNDAIKIYLECLARYHNIELHVLIRSHIQSIVVSLLLKGKLSQFDINSTLTTLCTFANKTPEELLSNKFTSITARLLLHYSIDRKRSTDGIYYLTTRYLQHELQPFELEFDDEKMFIDFLNPWMIGILLGVDSHFNASDTDLASPESVKHIESLVKLISLLDESRVQVIHVKLLSTLSLLLRLRPRCNNSELNKALRDLWAVFVLKLDEELKISLLITICVTLFDLVEDCPYEVAKIYEDLICKEPSDKLLDKLKSLFFIPNIPAFDRIYKYLTPYVRRENQVNSLPELKMSLDCVLPLTKLENNKCRLIALRKLRQLLKSNQQLLISNMLINLDEPLDSIISDTIQSLLALSSIQDAECSILISECLGILGAVNPIRLDHLIYGEVSAKRLSTLPNLSGPEFVVDLIERLKNFLLSSNHRSESESANYAIQVVVKTYQVFEDQYIQKRMSQEAIRASQLCQNTSYIGTRKLQAEVSIKPIYEMFKSECQYSYKDWLDKFFLSIVSIIKDEKIREVLLACSYIFEYNQKLAEFLLPATVIHIIINQPNHAPLIVREIMSILDEDIGVSSQDLDTVYDQEVSSQTFYFQCTNMVFCIMDSIHRLDCDLRAPTQDKRAVRRVPESLKLFIKCIPKEKLAILASKCRSHARALCYFEQHLFEHKNEVDKHATTLQRIYMALDDPYEAAGIEMIRTRPTTLKDDIANYEACGRFDKAFVCYSATLDTNADGNEIEPSIKDSLKCLSNQGDDQRLYEKSHIFLDRYPQMKRSILPAAVEASWKLGKWDDLDILFKNDSLDGLLEVANVSQGYLLTSLVQNRGNVFEKLKIVRQRLMKPLSIAMTDGSAYFRGYQNLLVLHSIEDFAIALQMLNDNQFETQLIDENNIDNLRLKLNSSLDSLFNLWNERNKLVQPSLKSLEAPISWQRSICLVLTRKYPFLKQKMDIELGRMWLNSSDNAREARSFERSFMSLTQAQKWFGSEFYKLNLDLQVRFYIEQAKLDWDQGEQTKAIRGLKLSLHRLKDHPLNVHLNNRRNPSHTGDAFPQLNNLEPCKICANIDKSERESFAKLKMLITHFSEEAAAGIPETLFYMYEECVHLGVNQEETYFKLARYYDRLLAYYIENPKLCGDNPEDKGLVDATQRSQNLVRGDREEVFTKLMEHSITAFGNSLRYGARYLNESMPRMLNIWYDLGSKKSNHSPLGTPRAVGSRIESTVRFMDTLKKDLPPYYFMSAISLILSRVTHPHSGVAKTTCEILELLLANYPHQLSWLMIALLNDKENDYRKRAAGAILNSMKKRGKDIQKIVKDTVDFSRILMEIGINHGPFDKNRPDARKKKLQHETNLKEITTSLAKFDLDKSKVIPPVQSTIRAVLPMGYSSENLEKHVVFPEQNRFFVRKVQPKVRIFNSLQQPRAIVVDCDNGKSLQLLCKAGDDLRKDSRCIEFFNLLNRILRRNSQSNARFFEIPTFLVLPLESYSGVIEMLPNCETLRSIVDHLYKERISNFTVHDHFPRRGKEMQPAELHRIFKDIIPKLTPAVLPTWFLRKFTEPTSWYIARLAYTRSTAVISMGGYIIGLGDRHLDNILFDTSTGRVAHVDFNLLFHQGETLPTPEVVPFRATHNIVAAFGPMGTEGNFRKVCEITMRVMRKEKDALLTTLKPFMHDPCSEWVKVREFKANRADLEDKHAENRSAKSKIEVIERKLKGFPRSKKFKPLTLYDSYSVEAQVDNLIEEATDTLHLSQMYYGWCPHI